MSVFDTIKNINMKSGEMERKEVELDYVPFLVNKNFSHFADTALYANEMNKYADCPEWYQYLFYYHAIPRAKRFAKWHKDEKNKYLDIVKEYYGYSYVRAMEVLDILTKEQLEAIEQKVFKGGRK